MTAGIETKSPDKSGEIRKRDASDTKQRLLQSAEESFAERGFDRRCSTSLNGQTLTRP
jgi:hypothetical protein